MAARLHRLEELSARIYDTVVDPSLWDDILSDLADDQDGMGASYMVSNIVSGASEVRWSRQLDQSRLDAFHAYYAAINPLVVVADVVTYRDAWCPTMMRDEDCIERSALERCEYFSDFLLPLGACRGLFLRLGLDGPLLTTISIGRGPDQDHFSDRSMARLGPFHQHAVRASRLARRFADLSRFSAGATSAMDAVDQALVMLDSGGRIVHVNPAAERMITEGVILDSSFNRLRAVGARSSASLAAAIARANQSGARLGSVVALTGIDGHGAAKAAVLPIGTNSGLEAASGPAVLIRIDGWQPRPTLDARIDRFGLTPAERSLVLLMLEGSSLRQAAAKRGISVHTARRQLADVFGKTGVHRQAELVALLTRNG